MRTPITYYGGKQTFVRTLKNMMPDHFQYAEHFLGGGALFWAKEKSRHETINDINDNVINFYSVVQNNFKELQKKVKSILHSRSIYEETKKIYNNPDKFDNITRAWALWCQCTMSYGSSPGDSGWCYCIGKDGSSGKITHVKRDEFTEKLKDRMERVQVEARDGVESLLRFDSENTFHYIDPPYHATNQGFYDKFGWDKEKFIELLGALSGIKGKFILSEYPSEILNKFVSLNKWNYKETKTFCRVNNGAGVKNRKPKIEVMVWNYEIDARLF